MSSQPPFIRDGFSLPRYYYTSEECFRKDVAVLGRGQWLLLEHAASLPEPGHFLVREILGESIVLLRDTQGLIRAWFNVCRHRGSRICLQPSGKTRFLTCPYHAWSYNLDGSVRAAPGMPAGFNPQDYALRPVHVGVSHGLIFVNLSTGQPPDFGAFSRRIEPFLARYGIATAKVAHRQRYRAKANWKLVVENNLECYHCRPSHVALLRANPGMTGEQNRPFADWQARVMAAGEWLEPVLDSPESEHLQTATLFNLGNGATSSTLDGQPAGPLMRTLTQRSESAAFILFNPISGMGAFCDYAFFMRFVPISATETDYEITWLVDADAREGIDYEVERLRALWNVTTEEDKMLAVNNQAGVESLGYEPGPYSLMEARLIDFQRWYGRRFAPA